MVRDSEKERGAARKRENQREEPSGSEREREGPYDGQR